MIHNAKYFLFNSNVPSVSNIVTTVLLRKKIQLLTVLFDKLTISERNLIGEELMEVFGNSMRMILDISQNLEIPVKTSVAKVLFAD